MWNKLMDKVTSREAYMIYGLVCGTTITIVAVKMKPVQIVVISNEIMGKILSERAAAGLVMS